MAYAYFPEVQCSGDFSSIQQQPSSVSVKGKNNEDNNAVTMIKLVVRG